MRITSFSVVRPAAASAAACCTSVLPGDLLLRERA